ncbi:MAG: ACP S-malonyltransferase [Ignavibacteriae bacterium]|nr:ACP S-malonyltransferase [Ignavibacteriota bacterium]
MNALLFAGQGSQYVGMIKGLADEFPQAKARMEQADSILGFSLSSICYDGPVEILKETRYTQPALFVHEAILVDLLRDKLEFSAVAGHSLGEYSALYAAGVLGFDDTLKLVALRGELMFRAGEDKPGTMIAVIGLADEVVNNICEKLNGNGGVIVAANYNSPGQVVVSGSADFLRQHIATFKEAGARMVTELPVSGAFHSPLLISAKERLAEAIHSTRFNDSSVDVYCNVSAKPEKNADELRNSLIEQLVSPVRWTETMKNMQSASITNFIEIGPGKVLQGLVKRTLSGATFSGFDIASDVQKIL